MVRMGPLASHFLLLPSVVVLPRLPGTNEAVLLIAKKSIDDIKARAEKYIKDGGTMSPETYHVHSPRCHVRFLRSYKGNEFN